MKYVIFSLILFLGLPLPGAELPLVDSFTSAKKEGRRPTRGEWRVKDGVILCTQDDALYKKYKDHGPVIWYDVDFTDATIKFSYRADEAVQTFVFTVNGNDGHVFRFILKPRPGMIKAFPREGEPEGPLAKDAPKLARGEWVDVEVQLTEDKSIVKIGDYVKEASHPAINQDKTVVGLGFSYGTMKFKDFSIK